jgi:hypothetical protein
MLTYVYIGSVGPVENVYVNKTKKYEFFTLWLSINDVKSMIERWKDIFNFKELDFIKC